jgi:NitT/TauT family transport system substrate-binding protein
MKPGTKARYKPRLLLTLILAAIFAGTAVYFFLTDRRGITYSPPDKITIAYATLPETAIAQIARVQGYYREEGLEAAAHLHVYGKLALREVLEGKADFATVAETPVMFAILNGEEISIIATIQNSKKNHAIVARKDRGIRTPQDLKGKRVATTPGITADYFMDAFLATNGIARKHITLVHLSPEDCANSIVRGQVDAVSTFHPFLARTQSALGEKGITFYDEDLYTETFNVVATRDFIRTHPEKVKKVLRALIRAEKFAKDNPDAAQKIVAGFCGISAGIVRDIWPDNSFSVRLDQSLILALEDESRWAIHAGLTRAEKIPDYLEFIYMDGLKSVKPDAVMMIR